MFIVELKLLEESLYCMKFKFIYTKFIYTKQQSCSLKLTLQYIPCSVTATSSKAKNHRICGTTAETLQTRPREVTWKTSETNQINSKTLRLCGKVMYTNTQQFLKDSHINNLFSIVVLKSQYININSFLKLRMKYWEKESITISKYNSKTNLWFFKIWQYI